MTFPPGPNALYQNLPIESQYYQPSRFVIDDITLGTTTLVTTSLTVNYVIGQLVRFIVPQPFGTRQLNEQQAIVLSIPSTNQVEVNINSTNYDAFIASSSTTKAQILAIGDINTGQINANGPRYTKTNIPGSFINISPI